MIVLSSVAHCALTESVSVGSFFSVGDLRVDGRVVVVRVVVVVRLRDPVAVQQDVDPVERVRVVLEPVGEADLSLRRLVADRRPVDGGVDDLLLRLEPIELRTR